MKKKVLFICVHNSARSQMAEALLNNVCGEEFEAHSAGLEPGRLNPLVVEAMAEIGIDISRHETKAVWDLVRAGKTFSYVISLCDEAKDERCPIFPGVTTRLHWSFPDPARFAGAHDERLAETRRLRDAMTDRIQDWCAEICGHIPAGADLDQWRSVREG
jgi:arsenate reductase